MKRFLLRILSLLAGLLIAQGFLNTANCAVISAGLALDCDYPLVGGVKDDIILMNLDDIAYSTIGVRAEAGGTATVQSVGFPRPGTGGTGFQ